MGVDATMFVLTKEKLTVKEVQRRAVAIAVAFGPKTFMVSRERGAYALSIEKVGVQDGPDLKPQRGETLIEVNLWDRYYGPGYERGDLPELIAVAEWLDRRFPGGRVLYGGDSSGICAEPFGPEQRKAMLDHFASDQGRDYFSGFGSSSDPKMPICDFCGIPYVAYSWGPSGRVGVGCHGCDDHRETNDRGATWTPTPKERQ